MCTLYIRVVEKANCTGRGRLSPSSRQTSGTDIKHDLVLNYRKPDNDVLQLVRLGSHGELGL
ncbi:MAG: hypothetical protein ABIP49_02710 [Lysobacterales bacterium]